MSLKYLKNFIWNQGIPATNPQAKNQYILHLSHIHCTISKARCSLIDILQEKMLSSLRINATTFQRTTSGIGLHAPATAFGCFSLYSHVHLCLVATGSTGKKQVKNVKDPGSAFPFCIFFPRFV